MSTIRDCKGREIFHGDLIRSPHFKERNGVMRWLYHVVYLRDNGFMEAVPFAKVVTGNDGGGRFWVRPGCPITQTAEIVDSLDCSWYDRPRKRKAKEAQ